VNLNPVGIDESEAFAVDAGRQVGYVSFGQGKRAAIWTGTPESMVDLHSYLPGPFQTGMFQGSEARGVWHDQTGTYVVGWAYNGVAFREEALMWVLAAQCPADFNNDGSNDFFDYDDFVACFEGGACPSGRTADFNDDGSVDFFDYDDFVAAFEAGC
jgi:hypothetical protein